MTVHVAGTDGCDDDHTAAFAGPSRLRGRRGRRASIGDVALAVGLLGAVGVAEVLTAYGDPRVGLACHIALLAACLCLSALSSNRRRQAFFLVLTIAPIIRITSTGMPLVAFQEPLWYLLTSIPLFCSAFFIAHAAGIGPRSLNLRLPVPRRLPVELGVWISGIGLGVGEWLILRPLPLVDGRSVGWLAGGALILLICTGFVEELLFRGLLQYVARQRFGATGGLLFTAGLFAALHIGHRSWTEVVFVAVVGLYFGLVVLYTRSLLGVTLAHGTINCMLFIILPLTVAAATPAVRLAASSTLVPWDRPFRLAAHVQNVRPDAGVTLRREVAVAGQPWVIVGTATLDLLGNAVWYVNARHSALYSVVVDGRVLTPTLEVRSVSVVTLRREPRRRPGQIVLSGRAWPPVAVHHQVVLQQERAGGGCGIL